LRTSKIAELVNVHPNTVRLYEQWGYISPVPRKGNGYREYSDTHLKQMSIARLAFKQEFIQHNLRKKATKVVTLSGSERFKDSLQEAIAYLSFLQSEYEYTLKAIEMVKQLLQTKPVSDVTYTHKAAAEQLQLTEETLRHWERNGLFQIKRNAQNIRMYTERDLQQLLIIRTLRSAHFSITSIAHLLHELQQNNGQADILCILHSPQSSKFKNDFFHVTDDLLNQLVIAMKDVEAIIAILEQLQTLRQE
jgi:DNA-binding transcriptional MerR regulator